MTQEKENYGSMGSLDAHLLEAETTLRKEDEDDSEASSAANVGNVDKIRDILFGTQQRDYEKRFKRLEDRFSKDNMHLRDDMLQKLKSLEELINAEVDSLGQRVTTERLERTADVQSLQHEINSVRNELTNRLAQLDEQFSKDLKQFRQQTHNKFTEIASQIRQSNENLTGSFKADVAQLQEEKVNRSDLAAFFSEFSLRLNRNFNPDAD
jgi:DNA anti-recombination protein RmuC